MSDAPKQLPLDFADCTWSDLDERTRSDAVIILPVGSTEAHGPHLPLSTDVVISNAMAREAARRLRNDRRLAFVLPAVAYSVTEFARDFAGSISLRRETARALLEDIFRSLVAQGFGRICVANSHLEPGHVDTIVRAIESIKDETGVAIAFPDKRRRRWSTLLTEEFRSGACHAGQYEGSIVLAERPDLVRDDVRASLPYVDASLSTAIREGKSSFREAGGDLAYFGRPSEATADEGAATIAILATMLIAAIDETFPSDNGIRD
jgi:creatinine amidohydrolase